MRKLRAIDVCAGAGGWAVAARGLPIKIVAAFDREKDALDTYKLNHPATTTVVCDVTKVDFAPWQGKVDLVLGGIPCEQISSYRSINKVSALEIEELEALISRCLALPEELGARWWGFEDVVQIEKHLPIFTKGFTVDSRHFCGQRRRRHFVGNLPTPRAEISSNRVLRDYLRPGPYRIGERLVGRKPVTHGARRPDTFYPWEPDAKAPTVITLTSRRDAEAATRHGKHWRQLEWQELAALQGFPTDYVFIGSPSRVTKMIAQAVQIDTARAILEALVERVRRP